MIMSFYLYIHCNSVTVCIYNIDVTFSEFSLLSTAIKQTLLCLKCMLHKRFSILPPPSPLPPPEKIMKTPPLNSHSQCLFPSVTLVRFTLFYKCNNTRLKRDETDVELFRYRFVSEK